MRVTCDSAGSLCTFVGDTSCWDDHLSVGVRVTAGATAEVTVGARETAITSTLGLVASNTSLLKTLAFTAGGSVDGGTVCCDVGGANDRLVCCVVGDGGR